MLWSELLCDFLQFPAKNWRFSQKPISYDRSFVSRTKTAIFLPMVP
jgi:hypothetical protein